MAKHFKVMQCLNYIDVCGPESSSWIPGEWPWVKICIGSWAEANVGQRPRKSHTGELGTRRPWREACGCIYESEPGV